MRGVAAAGRRGLRFALAGTVALGLLLSVASCSSSPTQTTQTTCAQLTTEARALIRDGRTADGRLDWVLDTMTVRCPAAYDELIDEVRRPAGRALTPTQPETSSNLPSGAIDWSSARQQVGSVAYVCGPLASLRNFRDDVFLNVGLDYPDPRRFAIVVWDAGPVESVPAGTLVCATGRVTEYEGVAQIELRDPSDVELW